MHIASEFYSVFLASASMAQMDGCPQSHAHLHILIGSPPMTDLLVILLPGSLVLAGDGPMACANADAHKRSCRVVSGLIIWRG
jgi:hypothetical protein